MSSDEYKMSELLGEINSISEMKPVYTMERGMRRKKETKGERKRMRGGGEKCIFGAVSIHVVIPAPPFPK
jgi:hypothetical protein